MAIKSTILVTAIIVLSTSACKKNDELIPKNPDTAEIVSVDRFSELAGHLMVRNAENGLPPANEPIDFDIAPFITQSFGPSGKIVRYYNFDVQSLAPAPIYVLFAEGAANPVSDQLNIIDVIPGETTYNDFWQVHKATVPADYKANTLTSYQEILDNNYPIEKTNIVVNCPVVPNGSVARESYSGGENQLHRGWYKGKVVHYFTFDEKSLTTDPSGLVPTSPIYVTFNVNPDVNNPESGPASGFVMETGSVQTHNITATIPEDADYSPLWSVNIYNNTYFSQVFDIETVQKAEILAERAAYVNCPVVYVEGN